MQALDILAVEQLFRYVALVSYYFSHIYKEETIRKKQLRFTERYSIPRIFTNYGKRLRKYYVPHIFNAIPTDLTTLTSINSVKKRMREHCLNLNV